MKARCVKARKGMLEKGITRQDKPRNVKELRTKHQYSIEKPQEKYSTP
jgi:hypothetical protein